MTLVPIVVEVDAETLARLVAVVEKAERDDVDAGFAIVVGALLRVVAEGLDRAGAKA